MVDPYAGGFRELDRFGRTACSLVEVHASAWCLVQFTHSGSGGARVWLCTHTRASWTEKSSDEMSGCYLPESSAIYTTYYNGHDSAANSPSE